MTRSHTSRIAPVIRPRRPALASRLHALRNISLGAGAVTAMLTVATSTPGLRRLDDNIERLVRARRPRLLRAAGIGTLAGEPYMHPAIGAAVACVVIAAKGGRKRRVLIPMAGASLGAIVAHHAVKAVYRRARPRDALLRGKREPAFPSGHTADATAVLATSAYLLVREKLVPADVAIPVAAGIAACVGVSRVALGWHWASDVVGGWLTGASVAAGCAAAYERLR